MKKIKYLFFTTFFALTMFLFPQNIAKAYIIEQLNFQNEGDIVVGPGKTEVWLSPGDSFSKEILISNRSGMDKIFKIDVEDFQASQNADQTLQFLGNESSPYSLKNYVKPETSEIILHHGERLRLPVAISIPKDAEPGGLYGAVMVSAFNVEKESAQIEGGQAGTTMKVVTRVASLFFVRIKGEVVEGGILQNLTTGKQFYEQGPVVFKITSQNTGNVHLSPYGIVEVKNMLGAKIDQVEIDPWFVMPKSSRTREIKWNTNFLLGRYTATLSMNRGYDDIIDTKTVNFWVIPWKMVSIILIGLILIIWFFVWVASHFELKKKNDNNPEPPLQQPTPPQNLPNNNQNPHE